MEEKINLKMTLGCIIIYVVGMSAYENLTVGLGEGLRIIPTALIFAALLFILIRKGVVSEVGIKPFLNLPYGKILFCLPMVALSTVNLWRGAVMRMSVADTVLYFISMLFVGAIEEILFRGLLLKTMSAESVRNAIIVSSLTFGLGHIVNLLNGEDFLSTGLQVVYAVSIGFMLSAFAVKMNNIVPCIIFHGVFNGLSAFANEEGLEAAEEITVAVIISAVSVLYALWIFKKYKPNGE